MNSLSQTLISFGRTLAAAAVLAGALVSPSHALGLGDSIDLKGVGLSGPFVHTYSFALGATSGIKYSTDRVDFPPPFTIGSFTATLFSGATPIISGVDGALTSPFIKNSFILGSLAAGAYDLRISGLAGGASGVDGYTGSLLVTAPVPEPEIWAMMLVGVGLIGMRLRRKSRIDSARRFA